MVIYSVPCQKFGWPMHKTAHSIHDSLLLTKQSRVDSPAKPSIEESGKLISGIVICIDHSVGDIPGNNEDELKTLLISNAFEGNLLAVCKLLYFRADSMSTYCQGLMALNYAIYQGHIKIARVLTQHAPIEILFIMPS